MNKKYNLLVLVSLITVFSVSLGFAREKKNIVLTKEKDEWGEFNKKGYITINQEFDKKKNPINYTDSVQTKKSPITKVKYDIFFAEDRMVLSTLNKKGKLYQLNGSSDIKARDEDKKAYDFTKIMTDKGFVFEKEEYWNLMSILSQNNSIRFLITNADKVIDFTIKYDKAELESAFATFNEKLLTFEDYKIATYEEASKYLEEGKYDDAKTKFEKLAGFSYKNSATLVSESVYRKAAALLADGKIEEAKSLFSSLKNFKDSSSKVLECDYKSAEILLNEKKFEEAQAAFEKLGRFSDAKTRSFECRYNIANILEQDIKYEEASAAFRALGTYSDSAQRANECQYKIANDLMSNLKYDEARAIFKSLKYYKDSVNKYQECSYNYASELMTNENYEEAAKEFRLLRTYKEAPSKARECQNELDYRKAVKLEEEGKKLQAYSTYKSISSYKDASEKANTIFASYDVAKNETTYSLWSDVRKWGNTNGYSFINRGWGGNKGREGEEPTLDNQDMPVVMIPWKDVITWCNAYSEMEGLTPVYYADADFVTPIKSSSNEMNPKVYIEKSANGYRLPTEEEWEFFAKAGEEKKYSGANQIDDVGWYGRNSGTGTHKVGQKVPNSFGLYDMTGNVWEWCDNENINSDERYLKGGSWKENEIKCTIKNRSKVASRYRSPDVGFRVIRTTN